MSRLSAVLVSLVAAVPGAALAYLMVTAFLGASADNMSGTLMGLAAATLGASALMAVLPVGIFLFTPKPKAASEEPEPFAEVPDEQQGAVAVGDEEGLEVDEDFEAAETEPGTADELDFTEDDFGTEEDDDEFDFGEVDMVEEGEDFDFEDEEKS